MVQILGAKSQICGPLFVTPSLVLVVVGLQDKGPRKREEEPEREKEAQKEIKVQERAGYFLAHAPPVVGPECCNLMMMISGRPTS